MQQIVDALKQFTRDSLSYSQLGTYVKSLDSSQINYQPHLPPFDASGNYTRNILLLEPLECVLLHWPPGVESAIHHHEGFWGYVLVLEGACDNVEYQLKNGKLTETRTIRALCGGVLDEPDGTIHKITNPSRRHNLVTLHFYYPALDTLDGLRLFDPEQGTIAVLNEKAESASLNLPPEQFHAFEKGAFTYQSYEDKHPGRSHRTLPVVPKPDIETIRKMIAAYYQEQAREYDDFDLSHHSRKCYLERINQLIADELHQRQDLTHLLAIACGTGRRAARIREDSGKEYFITCVDLSEEMCCQATERGVETCPGAWLEVEVPDNQYQAVTFLYAFGHIPHRAQRHQALRKIFQKLQSGGALYLDVFNAYDKHEWGPSALKQYEKLNLKEVGYERGDVFYQKVGAESVAYLHYFSEHEICELLEEAGFQIEWVKHIGYVHRSGEILDQPDEGSLFLKAIKP